MKREEVVQKNWRARKKHGSWLFVSSLLVFTLLAPTTAKLSGSLRHVSYGAEREIDPSVNLGNAEYNPKAKLIVTPDNQDTFFTTSANAHKDGNVVTLTDDAPSRKGAYTLFNKISLSESFELVGKINIGKRYEGYSPDGVAGGDGVSFVFTTSEPGVVGLDGASIGLGGIPNSFGFKLDTYHNTSTPNGAAKSDADPKFPGYQNGAFGAFYHTDGGGRARYAVSDAKRLTTQPTNNEFKKVIVSYNGSTKKMTVTYDGQVFERSIQDWINYSRRTTRQVAGQEELAFALFASTGGARNLQQFKLERFEYTAGGSYVTVKYVDADTKQEIKSHKTFRSDGSTPSVNLSSYVNLDGYKLVATNVSTARGYQSGDTVNYVVGSQTVTYAYRVDKDALKAEIAKENTVKNSDKYKNATDAKKKAYDDALAAAKRIDAKSNATVEEVKKAKEDLANAAAALDGQATNKDALKAEIAKENDVKASAKYKNGSADKKQAYDDALAEAKRIDAKTDATQAEVNKAKQDLADAAAALDGIEVNKDALKAEIAKDPTVKGTDKYKNATDAKKQAYDDALAEAKRIDAKEDATQAEVNKAKQDLADAAAALDGQATNKDALKAEIAKDPTVKANDKYKNATDEKKQAYDDALAEAKRIDAKTDATQAEVNKAKQDLADAAAALDGQPTDKDALKAEIAKDPTVKADDKYKNATENSKKAYDDALAEAKRIDAKTDATQAEVNKAKQDLANAAAALDGQPTDKDALKAEIAKDPTVKADDKYKNATENSKKAYDDALAEAKRIDAKIDATQAEVNKAKKDLEDAAAALDGQATNKDALKAEIAKDPTVKADDKYKNATENSKKAYDDVLAEAKRIDAKTDATQAEVNKAKQDLANAAAALDGQATNKDALKAEIAKDPTVKADDKYKNATDEKKQAYDDALAEAKRIDAKTDATQAEVNKAKKDLEDAAAALDGQATNKDALKAEIAKDPTVKADDKYKNATDEKKEAYDDALAEAKRIDAKTDATQAEVNKAKQDLANAAAALDGQPTNKDDLQSEVNKENSVKDSDSYKNGTEESKKKYDDALQKAKDVLADSNASQAEVDKAKKDLEDAAAALDGQPTNKDDLQSEVDKENSVKDSDTYKKGTEESKKKYDDALQKAKDVLADSNASQAEVDKAKKDLEDAKNALDGQPTDKDALKAEIAKDPTVKANDKYKNATDEKKEAYDKALEEAKKIDEKEGASQAEVDKAKEDLANAAAALDGQPTDKDALKAEIAKDPTTKADDKYKNATDEKKQAYDDALAEAKRIDAKTDATQAEVNKAKQDLANAAAALDGQPTDKDALKAEIAKDPTVKADDKYKNATENSKKAYDDALAEAKRIDAKTEATQAEVNKAKEDLANAAAALDGQPTDKDALKAEIAKDPTVKADSKYKNATDEKKEAYDKALEEAKKVDEKEDATQAEVNKAKQDLANAAAALDGQPTDKDALKAEIAKDPTVKADDKYKNATDEKKEAYDKALEEAKKVDEKEGASQAEVDKAKKDLEDAKNALDGQPTNKDDLQSEVNKENDVKGDDKYKNATEDSKKAYDDALQKAKDVLADSNASQADVDKAKKDLEDAAGALDGQPTDKDALKAEIAKDPTVKDDDKYKNATDEKKEAYDKALEEAKKVDEKEGSTQAEVNKAKEDLANAAAALDGQPTDKDALKAEIAKETDVKSDDKYKNATDEKKEAYDKALEEAKKVDEKEGATQAEVDKAKKDLEDAKNALDGQPTDKDALKAEIAKDSTTKADDKYKNATDEKKEAYDKALEEAKKVDEKEGATQAEVDKAKKDLEDAKNALDGQPTNKDALKAEIAKDPATKADDKYKNATDEKKEAYDKALEEAKKVDEKEGATQAEVDKAKKDLEDAKNALDGQPTNKDALKSEADKENDVKDSDGYKNGTEEAKKKYDDALQKAKDVLADPDASQAEVDKAKKDLEDAKDALDGKETDKNDLQAEVNKENNVKDSDSYKNATDESKKKYDDALQKAKDVLADSNASQADVDKAKKDLEDAKNALDGQPTDKDALKAEIAKDPTTKADDKYKNATDEKKEAYDKALEEAKKVDEKEGASQAEVDKAKKDLEDAKNALDGQPTNKDALQAEADKENDVKGSDEYKNASEDAKKKYDDALDKAKEVLNDPDATQAEVDKAKKDLEEAKGDLDGKETDKGSLKSEVDKEDTVKGSDEYKNASEDAKKKYDDALQKAKDVLNNPNASQKEVDKAKEDLVNALKGLNGKPNVSQDSRNENKRLPKTSVGSESLLTTFMSLVGGLYVFKKKRKK